MSVTDEIKQRLDIVELINESGVPLRKAGRNYAGFCPFHPNTRTPAFYVFPDTQSYYCFSCHAAGDAFNFVMARQNLDFGEALRILAGRAGVQIEQRTPEQEHEDAERARLRQLNHDAATYWQYVLTSTQKGRIGQEYAEGRGLDRAAIETWQLGYAPDDWSDLLSYLTDRKGYTPDEIERAGLAIKRERGGYYDRFRNRLMFPIRNIKGEIVGFGGRALGDDPAKYMNTPETPLFHKGSVLYGIDLAREAARRSDAIVLVEGYIDVITAHQAGLNNVVAPMGTALTSDQARILRRLAHTVYFALDADTAGTQATVRGLQALRGQVDDTPSSGPTPQGYLRWERELQGEIRIMTLPPGRDPDEVIRANPDDWRMLIETAQPLMDYYLDQSTRDLDLHSAKGRSEAVKRLAPLIGEIQDLVERAHYTQQLAQRLGLDEQIVAGAIAQHRRATREPQQAKVSEPAHEALSREEYILLLLLSFPEVKSGVECVLSEHLPEFPQITGDLQGTIAEALTHVEHQLIWQAWSKQTTDSDAQMADWLEGLDPYLQERVQRLLAYKDMLNLPVVGRNYHAAELAKKTASELRRAVVINRKNQLKAMYESVDDDATQRELIQRLDQLNRYQNTVTAPRPNTVYADLGSRRERLV